MTKVNIAKISCLFKLVEWWVFTMFVYICFYWLS